MDQIVDEYLDGLFTFKEANYELFDLLETGKIDVSEFDWAISIIARSSRYAEEMEEAKEKN